MRTALLIAITLSALILSGCAAPSPKPIGGDKDEHGCLIGAGYQWCPSTEKCQRMWEEYCEEYRDQFKETNTTSSGISNFDECVAAGNPIMESYPRQCRDEEGQTFVEEVKLKRNMMTAEEAREIAEDPAKSKCPAEGDIKEDYEYNNETETWWFGLDASKPGCILTCVVDERLGLATVDSRCTGALTTSEEKDASTA